MMIFCRRSLTETLERIGNRMSDLTDAIATMGQDNANLIAEVEALIGSLEGIPAVVSKAVADALAEAGVDKAAALQAIADIDAATKAETQKAIDALTPPAPPPVV